MTRDLVFAFIFDGPAGMGGMRDFVNPQRTLTLTGTANYTQSQRGNTVNTGFGATAGFTISPTITTGINYSVDFLAYYDGQAHADPAQVIVADTGTNEYIQAGPNAPAQFNVNGQGQSTTIAADNLSGWHRVGLTVAGTAVRWFLNGQFGDAQTMAGNFSGTILGCIVGDPNSASSSWGQNCSDIFFWNRTLSDAEMAYHAVEPYMSVLRPKWSVHTRIGSTVIPQPFVQLPAPSRIYRVVPY